MRNTYHDPDEHWQSLEIAHAYVFGYGYVTWEWRHSIRSSPFVWIWVAMYSLLRWLNLDGNPWCMHLAPKFIMSLFTTMSDAVLFIFIQKIANRRIAIYSLLASLMNIFNLVYATRTLSNSIEMVFTGLTLHCAMATTSRSRMYFIVLLIGISSMIRPTNAMLWVVPVLAFICRDRLRSKSLLGISSVLVILCIALSILAIQAVMDTVFYRGIQPIDRAALLPHVMITPYNFFKYNISYGISSHYGVMPWYWYIAFGIPFLLTTWIPFFAVGCMHSSRYFSKSVIYTSGLFALSTLVIYSCIAHKEFRFIYPVLPAFIPFIGAGMAHWSSNSISKTKTSLLMIGICLLNISVSVFLNRYHNCGILPTMDHIADIIHNGDRDPSFVFLMPCHATPWLSYIHHPRANISMLTCEHPSLESNRWLIPCPILACNSTRMDETALFYSDPAKYAIDLIRDYDYVVIFDSLYQVLYDTLCMYNNGSPLPIIWRQFNSFFNADDKRIGDILILMNKDNSALY